MGGAAACGEIVRGCPPCSIESATRRGAYVNGPSKSSARAPVAIPVSGRQVVENAGAASPSQGSHSVAAGVPGSARWGGGLQSCRDPEVLAASAAIAPLVLSLAPTPAGEPRLTSSPFEAAVISAGAGLGSAGPSGRSDASVAASAAISVPVPAAAASAAARVAPEPGSRSGREGQGQGQGQGLGTGPAEKDKDSDSVGAVAAGAHGHGHGQGHGHEQLWAEGSFEEPEPAPETPEQAAGSARPRVDLPRERAKAGMATAAVAAHWAAGYCALAYFSLDFEAPDCPQDTKHLRVCEKCGTGNNIMPIFGEWEKSWPWWLLAAIYFLALGWTFLGISIVCDQFMGAIEVITMAERTEWHPVRDGTMHKFRVRIWNDTVANLTLMALGSSAPEILLSVIEIANNGFYAGELGPSTIVGSAAFNLLVITAVCICAIPAPDVRVIEGFGVFSVTAVSSVLAYAWLLVILLVISPDLVEVWEAVLTLLLFPALCVAAFVVDKGLWKRCCLCCHRASTPTFHKSQSWVARERVTLEQQFGQLPSKTMALMLKQRSQASVASNASRAKIRANITKGLLAAGGGARGVGACSVGFAEAETMVMECAGSLLLKVVASRPPGRRIEVTYCTEDLTASEGVRYRRAEGALVFEPGQTERCIEVEMIDDETWQMDETFLVKLLQASELGDAPRSANPPRLGLAEHRVTVMNDDIPGTLAFDVEETCTQEGLSTTLRVVRTRGCTGAISCSFTTVDGTAIAGRDYEPQEGVLEFEHGETFKTITVPILKSTCHEWEDDETLQVVLSEASPGVKFAGATDAGGTRALCDVIIAGNRGRGGSQSRFRRCGVNSDLLLKHFSEWWEQLLTAFFCNGGPEEQAGASLLEWCIHAASLPWKVLFAAVPPPCFGGGWLCFVGALAMIALVTVIVGELARLLGCVIGIGDDVTAITLVALGTSLPDTVASKLAAQQDSTADNSIGNVTGSNSVNVFLGLGLPWTIAAIYWDSLGATEDWKAHVLPSGQTYWERFGTTYPKGGFLVPAGTLAFSVLIFTACALSCISLLVVRRMAYGGELGGPRFAQLRDAMLLLLLWASYIAASIVNSSLAGE